MSTESICKGIVLCFNFIPESIEVNIKYFWEDLAVSLEQKGFFLIVATTAELNSDKFKTIKIPYNLIDFNTRYKIADVERVDIDKRIVDSFKKLYRCDERTAENSLALADMFYDELLSAISPSAVMGWQSTNISTYLVRKHAVSRGIPYWSGERGLLKNTLMFDLGDNYFSSELIRSFTINKLYEDYRFTDERYTALKKQYISDNPSGKYVSKELLSRDDFRIKHNIPLDAKVVVFFLHAELGITASYEQSQFLTIHGMPRSILVEKIRAVTQYCEENQVYFVFQDHPLNKFQPGWITIKKSPYVIQVEENIHSLLRAGDCYLHTLSTILFESVFYEKPIGLLAKNALHMKQGAYHYEDYAEVSAFMAALLSADDWHQRLENLKKRICFLYEYFLIKIDDDHRRAEAERVSEQLAFYENPVDDTVIDNINLFLQRWG